MLAESMMADFSFCFAWSVNISVPYNNRAKSKTQTGYHSLDRAAKTCCSAPRRLKLEHGVDQQVKVGEIHQCVE